MYNNIELYERDLNKNISKFDGLLKSENIKCSMSELINLNKERNYIRYKINIMKKPGNNEIINLKRIRGIIKIKISGQKIIAEICNTKECRQILLHEISKFNIKKLKAKLI